MGHRVSESEISDHSKEITCWFSKWHEINLHCVYSSSVPSSLTLAIPLSLSLLFSVFHSFLFAEAVLLPLLVLPMLLARTSFANVRGLKFSLLLVSFFLLNSLRHLMKFSCCLAAHANANAVPLCTRNPFPFPVRRKANAQPAAPRLTMFCAAAVVVAAAFAFHESC